MKKLLIFLAILAALFYAIYCVYNHNIHIEADVAKRTQDAVAKQIIVLDTNRNTNVTATVSGRDVTLTGTVESTAVKQQLAEAARQTKGVRGVTNNLVVTEKAPVTDLVVTKDLDAPATPNVPVVTKPPVVAIETQKVITEKLDCNKKLVSLLAQERIQFTLGSSTIRKSSYPLLQTILVQLNKCPTANITVAGYTDNQGSEELNQKLSLQRASAVVSFLKNAGATQPLNVKGYGEANPIATNETAAGRALNRRIELIIE